MQGLTVDNFIQFWNGIYGDYDGWYGPQCFDLANYYSRWIGGQRFTGGTADAIYQQTQNGFYTQIANEPLNYPVKGDIVIFNWPHVGIATGKNTDVNHLELLEMNDPKGSNSHIKFYDNYNGVIGWLRPVHLP